VRLAKMDNVCEFISKTIHDDEESCKYIIRRDHEYNVDMPSYVISYLKTSLGDIVIDPLIILENEKTVVQFTTGYRKCEIYEYTDLLDDNYWVAIIFDPVIDN
jgi:hypothetical protein